MMSPCGKHEGGCDLILVVPARSPLADTLWRGVEGSEVLFPIAGQLYRVTGGDTIPAGARMLYADPTTQAWRELHCEAVK